MSHYLSDAVPGHGVYGIFLDRENHEMSMRERSREEKGEEETLEWCLLYLTPSELLQQHLGVAASTISSSTLTLIVRLLVR